MSNTNPLISIIVRTKDRPKLLKRALESIVAQDYSPIEVVLVNDGERLNEDEIANLFNEGQGLKIVDNLGRGRTVAANEGIRHATGQFVCFLDDDDIIYPDHVSTLTGFLSRSDYRIAYTESVFVHVEYDPEKKEMVETKRYPARTMDFSRETLLFYNYIPFMCLMFQRDVLDEAGGLDESFDMCEDWDLTIRISSKYPFYHIGKVTSEYSIWSRDIQSIRNNEVLHGWRKKIYEKHHADLTPDVIAEFIFNGYWHSVKFMEDYKRELEEKIREQEEEIMKSKERIKTLVEENRQLKKKEEILRTEKTELWQRVEELQRSVREWESFARDRAIRVPPSIKKFLKKLLH
ncbi:MAG: glycosyltransferase family 2 protein [Nitrospirae bacterium]|nr:MAG: glycosyltransferase family 2 protein [Nitrospirota bacterium]